MDSSFMIGVGPRSASQLVKSFFLIRWHAWLTFFVSAHFFVLGLRCPMHYSAQTVNSFVLLYDAMQARVSDAISRHIIFKLPFLDFNLQNNLRFQFSTTIY